MERVVPIHNYKLARAIKAVDRLFPSVQDMSRVAAARATDGKFTASTAEKLARHLAVRTKEAKIFHATRRELLATCKTDEEKEQLLKQYLRVPQHEINGLRKLSQDERVPRLLALMAHYKPGNGGHDKHHIDRTNYGYNPYDLEQKKDHLGLSRRPQFIYETIDKLLLAVLFPERWRSLFFHKTRYHVAKWKDCSRQIRSEGRESMLKVLIVLLLNFNARRMISGIRNDDGSWRGLEIDEIARRAEISYSRVKEALRNLEALNILWVGKQKREKDKDSDQWRGFAVVRAFKFTLFAGLKLSEKLAKARILRPETDDNRAALAVQPSKGQVDVSKMLSAGDILAAMF
jgi:hypothetical protein